ncbi:MAG TPA: 2-C-methyl-D-erythritol 2,4-cyclodiphosphate synthase [bacterium]|nr:2-C-methyl-D-erythritol 2,4-cyclodiphosphate synthase [bacterium]
MSYRTGIGVDVHRLVRGRPMILGGVTISSERGIEGHSDGDVLSHSLVDALLGAASSGDIGSHFPSSDPKYRDISSLVLLGHVLELIREQGYEIQNTDSTIIVQSPKLAPYITAMKEKVAGALGCDPDAVSVKATTTDYLGFLGTGEGIAALSTVLITR